MLRSIPLPLGNTGLDSVPRSRERVYNLIPGENGQLLSRPGISDFASSSGIGRGSFSFQGRFYRVSGHLLQAIEPTGAVVDIGAIQGSDRVHVAVDHARVAICVRGGSVYTFDGSTLTETSLPPVADVAQIDGIFVYIPVDGGPASFSDVGLPGTVKPESFFDAESLPDRNTGSFVLNGTVYMGGSESIELYRHTGPATSPLVRVLGGTLPIGYVGGKTLYKDAYAFLGRNDGHRFYVVNESGIQEISTPVENEVLEGYSDAELAQCWGYRFTWQGHDVLVFRLARHTFAFVAGRWVHLSSGYDHQTFRALDIIQIYDRHMVLDASGAVGFLSDEKTEFGEFFQREFSTFLRGEAQAEFPANSVEVETVPLSEAGSIALSLSRDGVVFGPESIRALPAAGQYGARTFFNYPGGLGSFRGFLGMKFRTAEPVDFNADAVWLDYGQ